jgi:hypothetical protein
MNSLHSSLLQNHCITPMAAVSQAAAARTSPISGAAGDYCDTQLPPSSLSEIHDQ